MSTSKKRKLDHESPQPPHQNSLPPLPPILSPALESAAFTHASLCNPNTPSYERLEFLGDAYIELIATRLIYPAFPTLTPGRMSQKRELLVKNETLAEYALAYGFDKRARLPRDFFGLGSGRGKLWTKTMGDLFEAYVAAVVLSDPKGGFETVEAWLTELWREKLFGKEEMDREVVINEMAKVELSQRVGGKGVKIDYRYEKEPEMVRKEGKIFCEIGVYLTGWGFEGVRLGGGRGLNKVEAGNRAAMEALKSEVVEKAASIKRDFDAKVREEREKDTAAANGGEKKD